MILQALVRHYENLAEEGTVPREGWCQAKVSYGICLSKDGAITGLRLLKRQEVRGVKTVEIPVLMTVPEMVKRSSGVRANFLCDNAKYLLGIDANGTNPRLMECFKSTQKKHLSLLKQAKGDMAEAVRLYFKNWDPSRAQENPTVKELWDSINDGGNLVFCMGETYAQEDEEIRKIWKNAYDGDNVDMEGVCLVTGKHSTIARIHKSINGVPGAQSSGAALVSFNAPAFESYGKEQGYNAPVGKYAEFAYTTALKYLLSQQEYTLQVGDTRIVFWAECEKKEYQDLFFQAAEAKTDNQKELVNIFKHSKELGDCPAYKLFDAVEVCKNGGVVYPRSYQDYNVKVHEEQIPDSVEVKKMI